MTTLTWLLLIGLILTFVSLVLVIAVAGNGLQDAEQRLQAAVHAGKVAQRKVDMLTAEMDRRGFKLEWEEADIEADISAIKQANNVRYLFGDGENA